jgi:hypothetical protein
MTDGNRGAVSVAALVLLCGALAHAQTSWVASPLTTLSRTQYSVYGPAPECVGQLLVDSAIRRTLGRFGLPAVDADTGDPTRLARTIGDAMNVFGLDTVLQTHAECAEVCAVVPLDAVRVTAVIGYMANGVNGPFAPQPFGQARDLFLWEADIDTTRVTDTGRLVCARARNWLNVDRHVFLVVGYER